MSLAEQTLMCSCEKCGQGFIVVQYPGRAPLYCPKCRPTMIAEKAAARARRYRARKRTGIIYRVRYGWPQQPELERTFDHEVPATIFFEHKVRDGAEWAALWKITNNEYGEPISHTLMRQLLMRSSSSS